MDSAAAVARVISAGPPLLVVCDYDGTLAPIVTDPQAAVPAAGAVTVLADLLAAGVRVAVVSGRPVEFLRRQLARVVAGVALVGQYGLERLVDGAVVVDPRAAPFAAAVAGAADECVAAFPGLYVERKGAIAVTVHWRAHGMIDAAALERITAIAHRYRLAVHETRMARELRVPVPLDKGAAVAAVVGGLAPRAVLFAGDDHGDLSAFAALDRARDQGAVAAVVKVGVVSDEAPPALVERADLLVDGPEGVLALLRSLVDASGTPARPSDVGEQPVEP